MTRRQVATLRRRVREALDSMTYKPGWTVKLNRATATTLYFRTLCVTDDASGTVKILPGDSMTLDMVTEFYYAGEKMTDQDIRNAIDRVIQGLNKHEHEEWLKFNGVHHTTPTHGLL
jgi:hypothetical protein